MLFGERRQVGLMIDLNDSNNPKIHIRTWQPEKNDDGSIREAEPGVPELKIDSIKAATKEDYANAAYEEYANSDINAMDRKTADDFDAVESVKSSGRAMYKQDYEGASKVGSILSQTVEDRWFDIAFSAAGLAFKKAKKAAKAAKKFKNKVPPANLPPTYPKARIKAKPIDVLDITDPAYPPLKKGEWGEGMLGPPF